MNLLAWESPILGRRRCYRRHEPGVRRTPARTGHCMPWQPSTCPAIGLLPHAPAASALLTHEPQRLTGTELDRMLQRSSDLLA